MKKNSGVLIVFEGIDGSGKTTVSKKFHSFLKGRGDKTIWMREPSESPWGEKIRELASCNNAIPITEELDYFIKDRKWNVKHNIIPALKNNNKVVMDRYFYSTACYQGARGLDMGKILVLNRSFAPEPDITFIIDTDVDTALQRINLNRASSVKLFEKKDFLVKVRTNYLTLASENILHINGNLDPEEVFNNTIKGYLSFFPDNG